jgi:hypothetical protein
LFLYKKKIARQIQVLATLHAILSLFETGSSNPVGQRANFDLLCAATLSTIMHSLIGRFLPQPAGKRLVSGCINEKKRYAAHIGTFLSNPSRGEKLAHRCLFNKRSRACLALYTAIDIAYRVLREEQVGPHGSAHRQAIKQAADQVERDLVRIRDFLRPVFLDRRSFLTQFTDGGDIDDEHARAGGRYHAGRMHCGNIAFRCVAVRRHRRIGCTEHLVGNVAKKIRMPGAVQDDVSAWVDFTEVQSIGC